MKLMRVSHATTLSTAGYNIAMQTPVPREQVALTQAEVQEFDTLASAFERVEEHLLDQSLMLYITR